LDDQLLYSAVIEEAVADGALEGTDLVEDGLAMLPEPFGLDDQVPNLVVGLQV